MITIQDLYNIVGNKIANEAQKALIRTNFPPQIAEQVCNAIDGQERAEHFQRLLREYNEWMQNQQRQQETVQDFCGSIIIDGSWFKDQDLDKELRKGKSCKQMQYIRERIVNFAR